jgi:hypothetical protein
VNRARLAQNRAEWACIAFAVIVAHAFLVHEWFYPSAWDATQYVEVARDIADHGMFRQFAGSAVRTYGYPLVLSFVLRAADVTGLPFVVLLFAFQFLAYVAAAYFLRRALAPVSPAAARIAFCGLLVNFYVLIYASQSLSESLSLTLLVFAAGSWVALWNNGLAPIIWPLLAGSLVVGFALMVRPANMFMVAAWVFGVAVVWLRHRPAGYAAMRLAMVNRSSVRVGVLFGIAAYVLVAMLLSGWVRDQSQQIREYRAARTKSVGLRGAGDACCAPATDSATREAAFDPPHSHGSRFAG